MNDPARAHGSMPPQVPPQQRQITIKDVLRAQYEDPESYAANKGVAIALATFTAAVVFVANFGDMLVPQF
ncbi:hypothetical protein OIV83_001294 [Microbotryomycetes sp. JL201]|nr:hypothetical protein OIV83_001294 [Microbotryomycetes sp. JL201]